MRAPPRLLVIFTALTLIVVAAIVSLATGWWWLLPVVVVIHLVGFALAMLPIGKALDQGDKPDPVTEAQLEEEQGVDTELGTGGGEQGGDPGRGTVA